MKLNQVGFIGWRGLVGSVLLQRMLAEDDFSHIAQPTFFTTSQVGQPGPDIGRPIANLVDAWDVDKLAAMDVLVTCQGGDYTGALHTKLRQRGWSGYWLDAASTLRMQPTACIILDPLNHHRIEQGLANGQKDFIGGNCTVSLMLMALHGLFKADLVEWVTAMTYQAISGGGARQMRELLQQMGYLHAAVAAQLEQPDTSILDIDRRLQTGLHAAELPCGEIGTALAANLLPWIDRDLDNGTSREEWKGAAETNKILGRETAPIPIESTCIRVATLRCHSQAFTIRLRRDLPLEAIEHHLATANPWIKFIANQRTPSLAELTPAARSGRLDIGVGRVKQLSTIGRRYISVFSVGDQLLWGAAEPLRRMLRILHEWSAKSAAPAAKPLEAVA